MLKLAVCVSGGGSNLQAIIDAIDSKAITNAEITPAIKPAMPTSTKFCSGTDSEVPAKSRFKVLATKKPAIAPTKRVGPKVPPTPPPAFVKVIENTFSKRISRKNTGTDQGLWERKSSGVCPSRDSSSPFSSTPKESYPSP